MGIPVLVLGDSGSGKSASMRNFEANEVGIFNVASKPLPFRKKLPKLDHADYPVIGRTLMKNKGRAYVIEDSQYLMAFELFGKINEASYAKFTQVAKNFYDLVQLVINNTSEDTIVYFLHHTEKGEDGRLKAKTSGKMLDSQLTLEGLFSIVLMAVTDGRNYEFVTQSDGTNTCKSPMEMFDARIPNDLKLVDMKIREYYGLKPIVDAAPASVKEEA